MIEIIDLNQLNPSLPEIAAIPWLWIIPVALGLFASAAIIIASTTEVDGKSLAVLGMKEAGKTQLYNSLREKEYKQYSQTSTDDYDGFTFKYGTKKIKIMPGRDIGGGETYIKAYYKNMIEEKDIIFFVFDAARYINDNAYANHVKARMDFIWRHMKNKYVDNNTIKTKLVTIGSHLDKIEKNKRTDLLNHLQNDVRGKDYSLMFHENFILANLTDQKKFINTLIEKKIFG